MIDSPDVDISGIKDILSILARNKKGMQYAESKITAVMNINAPTYNYLYLSGIITATNSQESFGKLM